MPTTCVVKIDGNDVSGPIRQTLESLEITLKAGGTSDTCGIELDDRNGQIAWPQEGVAIEVQLGDENGVAPIFVGKVDDVRSAGDRGGGMRMMITAKGFDAKGKSKQSQERHWDNATAQTILQDAGQTSLPRRFGASRSITGQCRARASSTMRSAWHGRSAGLSRSPGRPRSLPIGMAGRAQAVKRCHRST
jgi:hypothetical protein